MNTPLDEQLLILPATQGYHAEGDCLCVAQPSTGVEILLTGTARRVWEVVQAHRGLRVSELLHLAGGDPSEVGDALVYLCKLGVLETSDPGGW